MGTQKRLHKMSKSLYTKTGSHTLDANALSEETSTAVKDIWAKYLELGYSPREISHVMLSVILEEELYLVMKASRNKT
jgi:hypothetical protein